jgi:DNA-binding transcriptional MerR regulator
MDDFLHNLRMSKDRRFDRGRRPHDNQNYRKRHGQDNRKGNYRKAPNVDRTAALISEAMPGIKAKMDELVEQQKRLAQAGERQAQAEERKAQAMEKIANALIQSGATALTDESPDQAMEMPALSLVETSSPGDDVKNEKASNADTLIDQIQAMRANGLSYSKIAEDLNAQNMPTTSGRGKWRGPMVSKICREVE